MITIAPHLIWQDVGGELVLFDQTGNAYHCLDAIGSEIWRRLARAEPPAAVAEALADEYDAPPGRIEDDVAMFVTDACAKGLLIDTTAR